MRTLFDRFCEIGHRQVPTIVRAGSPGLFARGFVKLTGFTPKSR